MSNSKNRFKNSPNLPSDSLAFNRFTEKYGWNFGYFIHTDGNYKALVMDGAITYDGKNQFINELETEEN